jgi:hypothetical protein
MRPLIKGRYKAFRVGPLPADEINRVLGTELDVADVWVSKACHRHIAEDHPADYPLVKAHIVDILRTPTWVGQDARHGRNFYVVKRLTVGAAADIILVAIALQLSDKGTYNVRSAYRIDQADVDSRRLRGALKPFMLR